MIQAGPGTGKTAVACARLAHLVSYEDLEPSNTWMISFTRTAVAEIRARLHAYVGDAAFAIRVATIDSHAWSIHSGHDQNARLTGSYENNIKRVIEMLRNDEDVADELDQIEHVVIDEAQDIVGLRAELVSTLVEKLPEECGITIFADEAQAIYGFAEEGRLPRRGAGASAETPRSLLDDLRDKNVAAFSTCALSEIYRTASPGLREIFSDVRKEVLDRRNHSVGILASTMERIKSLADRSGAAWNSMKIADFSAGDLLLFRTRAEVLMASQFCDLPHSLRLSGYGGTLPSWLALCFHDWTEPFLSQAQFLALWADRVENMAAPEYGPTEAWSRLLRLGGKGDGTVEMRKLRRRLSQVRPPIEITVNEFGLPGPIVGTIHASKGREAKNVILILPRGAEFEDIEEEAEETRVLFVGATRARESLIVGQGIAFAGSSLDSGRANRSSSKSTMVEIGRSGDLTASGLVGREAMTASAAHKAQRFLATVEDVVTGYRLEQDKNLGWRYRIYTKDEDLQVGVLTPNLNYDLWNLLAMKKQDKSHNPPFKINYLRGLGCCTVVLGADDSELEALHEPRASSGFLLAPRIAAFAPCYFGRKVRS